MWNIYSRTKQLHRCYAGDTCHNLIARNKFLRRNPWVCNLKYFALRMHATRILKNILWTWIVPIAIASRPNCPLTRHQTNHRILCRRIFVGWQDQSCVCGGGGGSFPWLGCHSHGTDCVLLLLYGARTESESVPKRVCIKVPQTDSWLPDLALPAPGFPVHPSCNSVGPMYPLPAPIPPLLLHA